MKPKNNATLLKAARFIDKQADALRDSSSKPCRFGTIWGSVEAETLYRDLRRTADRLRAIVLEKNP